MTKITVIPEWFCAQRFLLKINYYFLMKKKYYSFYQKKKKSFLNALVKGYGQKAKKEKCLRPNKNWIPIIM